MTMRPPVNRQMPSPVVKRPAPPKTSPPAPARGFADVWWRIRIMRAFHVPVRFVL